MSGSPLPPSSEQKPDVQKENTPSANYIGDGKTGQGKNAPKALWECNICLETAKEPIITQCGHLYCWPCIHKWLIMHPIHQNCPVCNKDIVEELLIPLYGNESDSQASRKGNGGVGCSGCTGDGNGGSSGGGNGTVVSKIPSRPQGVHLPPNPNTPNNLSQANPSEARDVTRIAEAYPQQNNRRFGATVPGVAFQFGFRLLVTGESPGYAQQQALLSWMLLLLGSFVVFCLLVF
mmetsp:Transcript_2931/g.9019  ORF Transcript_2931/g.9019 Transcript_2931/m.9019 type:complete len:234 (+) Transcript_2931:559-1260(+)